AAGCRWRGLRRLAHEQLARCPPISHRFLLVFEGSHVVLGNLFRVHTIGAMIEPAVVTTDEPTISFGYIDHAETRQRACLANLGRLLSSRPSRLGGFEQDFMERGPKNSSHGEQEDARQKRGFRARKEPSDSVLAFNPGDKLISELPSRCVTLRRLDGNRHLAD